MKLNLPILLVLVRRREKLQKCFDLSAFKKHLNNSILLSTVGGINFQKWEFFYSPGIFFSVSNKRRTMSWGCPVLDVVDFESVR